MTERVGIRELRQNLSVYIDRVKAGETLEVTEQARGYFERITDSRGIFGPPAVLKALQEKFSCFVEANQFSAARTTADVLIELPVSMLPAFARSPTWRRLSRRWRRNR